MSPKSREEITSSLSSFYYTYEMESLQQENKQSAIVEMAVNGDLILVVGPDETRLRVNALFLQAASKPFAAMLGPDWKEGQSLIDRGSRAEIFLPEDNAAALENICAIIHHQNSRVSTSLTPDVILDVAIIADKYDCVDVLKFASYHWLRPGKAVPPTSLILLTAAAYLFHIPEAFKELTKALVLDYEGSYLDLASEEVEPVMPWKAYCKPSYHQFKYSLCRLTCWCF